MVTKQLKVHDFLEVKLCRPNTFLLVVETLTRMGVTSKSGNTLYQIVFLLHKKGRYYLVHYKELENMDGEDITPSFEDIGRRNAVARILQSWNLIKILSPDRIKHEYNDIVVLKHQTAYDESTRWTLKPKYTIGNTGKPRA